MDEPSTDMRTPFDDNYFSSGPYSEVSFARYSQYWWSNRFYAKLIYRYGPEGGRVLELGCGLGHLLGWLVNDYEIFGSDINHWALIQASKNVPVGKFVLLSAEDLGAFPDNSFQVVIAKHVVEHLPDPTHAIAEISRVLADDGLLLMATPNTSSLARAIKKDKWVGYKDPTHISLCSPDQWLGKLSAHHLFPRKVFSDGFWDAPYVSWLPVPIQRILFGAPGGLQAVFGWSIIPLRMGESMIVIARKK